MSFSYKNLNSFIHKTERWYLFGKMVIFVETGIDKQLQPDVGIATISNLFGTMSKTPVR
jgi:hypothetical protein